MRVTAEILLKIANDTVNQRARTERGLVGAYLHGSMLELEPFLGGCTDVDLVFIHDEEVPLKREIVRLTDEVHLDIAHHQRGEYRQARQLRLHPWLGPTLYECKILYDPFHFLDFTQASVRGQFHRPDYVMQRLQGWLEHARQMWKGLCELDFTPGLAESSLYLRAVEHTANAVASLAGHPLTERRFLMLFQERARALGKPGLYAGLLGLLGAPRSDAGTITTWLELWQETYQAAASQNNLPRLHPSRQFYYQKAISALVTGERYTDALWPLLRTWVQAGQSLPEVANEREKCQEALKSLGLIGTGLIQHLTGLDAYLDTVEEVVENWGRASGA